LLKSSLKKHNDTVCKSNIWANIWVNVWVSIIFIDTAINLGSIIIQFFAYFYTGFIPIFVYTMPFTIHIYTSFTHYLIIIIMPFTVYTYHFPAYIIAMWLQSARFVPCRIVILYFAFKFGIFFRLFTVIKVFSTYILHF